MTAPSSSVAPTRPRHVQPQAYAPLRRRTLLLQLVVLVPAETGLFFVYGSYDSRFHWGAHFLVALLVTCGWLAGVLLVKAAPARGQVVLVLFVHLYAMAPDLVFRGGVPHAPWMNVFLGHIAVHYLPGGDRSWLVLAVLAMLGYGWLLSRWVQARQQEAALGLAPGIGIGGVAVLRAQGDPSTQPLAHAHAGPDGDPPVLLLHGLGGTGRSFAGLTAELAGADVATLAPDLLGHGGSRRLGTRFGLAEQVDALRLLLRAHQAGPVDVLAHSYGCAVAVALARAEPTLVRRLVLVCPPAFPDAETAGRQLGERSWLARRTVAGAPLASLACGAMCLLREPLSRVAPRVAPDVPAPVARAGVAHSYPAYRDAVQALLGDTLRTWLADPQLPTSVVLAQDDTTAPPEVVGPVLTGRTLDVRTVPGGHLVPVTDPGRLAPLLRELLGR